MYYVYILKSSKDHKLYVGWTKDFRKRLKKHNLGEISSTKPRKTFKLVFYECFTNKKDAVLREKFFKSGWGRRHINKALKYTLGSGS
jgi:putative endonuclease